MRHACCPYMQRGKNENEEEKRELVYKEDGQEYGQVGLMQMQHG